MGEMQLITRDGRKREICRRCGKLHGKADCPKRREEYPAGWRNNPWPEYPQPTTMWTLKARAKWYAEQGGRD